VSKERTEAEMWAEWNNFMYSYNDDDALPSFHSIEGFWTDIRRAATHIIENGDIGGEPNAIFVFRDGSVTFMHGGSLLALLKKIMDAQEWADYWKQFIPRKANRVAAHSATAI
jgi:hypothetical protein